METRPDQPSDMRSAAATSRLARWGRASFLAGDHPDDDSTEAVPSSRRLTGGDEA